MTDISAASILVVDDEPDLRTLYELTLLREGYDVKTAESLAQARRYLHERQFDILLTDMRLPDGMGMELLHEVREQQRPERCIVVTAYGSAENAVQALKAGAFDYLTKPVDLKQFRSVVFSALQSDPWRMRDDGAQGSAVSSGAMKQKKKERPESSMDDAMSTHALDQIVGESEIMRAMKERISKVARSMAPVLVRGESGTGKELVAKAIHAASHRAQGPLVAVNCGAIPETLLEAEFFGARKGSYTGAVQDRNGFFQAACGGTLFLDEIGELPVSMQSKLLRAIQERRVRPLGATQEEVVNVRIVSATNRDLAAEVEAGRFRQDLFYRLNVIEIVIPALRERPQDLPLLCDALLRRIANETGMEVPKLSAEALAQIQSLSLPGNVRELENLLHRAIALSDGGELLLELPDVKRDDEAEETQAAAADGETLHKEIPSDLQAYLDRQERDILIRALQDNNYNRTAAATQLGISLRQMRYRIDRLAIPLGATHVSQNDDPA